MSWAYDKNEVRGVDPQVEMPYVLRVSRQSNMFTQFSRRFSPPPPPRPSIHPAASSLLTIFRPLLRISKTFQAFSSPCSSSRQIEEGFLNDPLIIGSGVTLGVFFSTVCMPSCLATPPNLFISLWFLRGFLFFFLLYPPPLFSPAPLSHFSLQNGFLVCLFVLMKWNAAKSLRAFPPPFFFWKINLKSHWVWVDIAVELQLPPPPLHAHTHSQPFSVRSPDVGLDDNNAPYYKRGDWEICGGGILWHLMYLPRAGLYRILLVVYYCVLFRKKHTEKCRHVYPTDTSNAIACLRLRDSDDVRNSDGAQHLTEMVCTALARMLWQEEDINGKSPGVMSL